MRLVVIIPAHNEEATIASVIREVPRSIAGLAAVRVFVIDDGSTDDTAKNALAAGADRVIANKQKLGLAKTFARGITAALDDGADIIVNTDADGQYDQGQIPRLIAPINARRADIVIGDRQIRRLEFMPRGNKYGNLLGSWVLRRLTGSRINDASSGFRAFSSEAALRLNVHAGHTYTHETIIQAVYGHLTMAEVPITFRARIHGRSKLIGGLISHIKTSALVIVRTVILYKPLKALFYAGAAIIAPGLLLGGRFVYYYLGGESTGKIQSLILAAILIIVGFNVVILGLIGDLIAKNRHLDEESLYLARKIGYGKRDRK